MGLEFPFCMYYLIKNATLIKAQARQLTNSGPRAREPFQ